MAEVFWDAYVVLTFTTLSCLVTQRVGIFNLAVQAVVLNSSIAFVSVIAYCRSIGVGLCSALFVGILTSVIFGISVIKLRLDAIVTGVAFNYLSLGIGTVIIQDIQHTNLVDISVPLADDFTFSRAIFAIVLIVSTIAIWYFLSFSSVASQITAIGEDSKSARLCDIPVNRIQMAMCVFSGVLAALGGMYSCFVNRGFSIAQWRVGEEFVALAIVAAAEGSLLRSLIPGLIYTILRIVLKSSPVSELLASGVSDALPWLTVIAIVCILAISKHKSSFIKKSIGVNK